MALCYIIYSKQVDRYYVEVTQDSISNRLEKHNSKHYGLNHYTSISSDWEIYMIIEVLGINQAIRLEQKIKSMKSRTYIKNLKRYPELVEKIKKETSVIT